MALLGMTSVDFKSNNETVSSFISIIIYFTALKDLFKEGGFILNYLL